MDPQPHSSDDPSTDATQLAAEIEELYRKESRRVFATLVRLLGDIDLAEEALHDAFAAAVENWPREGKPANPRAWLVSAGRFRAIDALRRRSRFDHSLEEIALQLSRPSSGTETTDEDGVDDDQLRLIFTCCHPALSPETQIALTLRDVCGLLTEEIGRAFLTSPSTIAQRIVRGKAKIRNAGIPYEVPLKKDLPERLQSVLSVIYLVFNEGYSASRGEQVTRTDLSREAIRLGRLLVELLPDPEAQGLLGLMLLQDSRRKARMSAEGDLILLEDQNRALWDQGAIQEGLMLLEQAFSAPAVGPYTIQGGIAAVHARASVPAQTDWSRIAMLYDLLLQSDPSPVIELNRAVALSMRDGPKTGVHLIGEILQRGELTDYHLAHAAQADCYRRLGETEAARNAYHRALELVRQEPERRYLEGRLRGLDQLDSRKRPSSSS